jgi:hypothetical protein
MHQMVAWEIGTLTTGDALLKKYKKRDRALTYVQVVQREGKS